MQSIIYVAATEFSLYYSYNWLPELKECAPKCPIVLAETKRDIRDEFEDARKSLDGKMRSERKIGQDVVS